MKLIYTLGGITKIIIDSQRVFSIYNKSHTNCSILPLNYFLNLVSQNLIL